MKVKITEFEGNIIIETLKPEKDEDFIPIAKGKVGSFLKNTGKHLGMSTEAWEVIKNMQNSADDLGELEAGVQKGGIHWFTWLGSLSRLIHHKCTLSNSGVSESDFIKIPNETSSWIVNKVNQAKA